MAVDYNEEVEPHITSEDFISSPRDEKKRRRAEKRRRKHYKFSDKKHSRPGIVSSILALVSFACIIIAVVLATKAAGEGGRNVGIFGAASLIAATAGIVIALVSFRQTDVYYRFSWLGLVACGVIWLADAVMIVMGI